MPDLEKLPASSLSASSQQPTYLVDAVSALQLLQVFVNSVLSRTLKALPQILTCFATTSLRECLLFLLLHQALFLHT